MGAIFRDELVVEGGAWEQSPATNSWRKRGMGALE